MASPPEPSPSQDSRQVAALTSVSNSSYNGVSDLAAESLARDLETEDEREDADEGSRETHPHSFGSSGPIIASSLKGFSEDEECELLHDSHSTRPDTVTQILQHVFGSISSKKAEDEEAAASEEATETSALLPNGDDASVMSLEREWQEAVASGHVKTTLKHETKVIWKSSWPVSLTQLLQRSLTATSIFVAGRLGRIELAAVSIAVMTVFVTGWAVFQGLVTALDTLTGQAFGSGRYHLIGVYTQRMVLFLWLLGIPIAIFWLNSFMLLAKIVDTQVAELASLYLQIMAAAIPGYAAYEGGKRFVQSQGLFYGTTCVLFISAPTNILLNYLLVWHFQWGFIGSPIAVAIVQSLQPFLLIGFVQLVGGGRCWGGFSRRAFSNWGPMIKLAFSGFLMVFSEFMSFEILTLGASFISTSHLAACAILTNLVAITFQIPMGFAIASSTRVANFIGASLPHAAKTTAKAALCTACVIGAINGVLVYFLRRYIALLFTSDEEVIQLFTDTAPIIAAFQFFDSLSGHTNGLLRGLGQQRFGGYTQFLAYYVIGLPISFGTAFGLHWALRGLYTGVSVALVFVVFVEICYMFFYKKDWQQSVDDAKARNISE